MPPPAVGTPVGPEIPVRDTSARPSSIARCSIGSSLQRATLELLRSDSSSLKVDSEMFPGGGIVKKVSGEVDKSGASKVFFYVDSIENAIEKIEDNGAKALDEKEADGDHAFYQYFRDSEGNTHAVYTYRR